MPTDEITVFISYSHDSPEHEARVLALAERLRADGIDAKIDQYQTVAPDGWQLWMEKQIRDAKFVLLVCTETYLLRVMKEEMPGKGLGVMWEASIIYSYLYDAGLMNTRFMPVVFEDGDRQYIPVPLKPTTFYNLSTDNGYDLLYLRLRDQPATVAGPLGKLRDLPPLPRPTMTPSRSSPATLIPNLVHPYPLQANFTGRVAERGELTAWLSDNEHPIYELVAMGGMGKSALTWYWLTQDVLTASDPKFDGVMWWSFYESDSSFPKFVDQALAYITGEPINAEQLSSTYDRAQELRRQLQSKRVVFVLDGVERQLRDYASLDAPYQSNDATDRPREMRECIDPNGARLLRDLAAGATRAKVLLTTRLAVSDLEDRAGDALAAVLKRELNELGRDDSVVFMRAQGVKKGTSAEIATACEVYGYHPLSLRLLSGLIARDARTPGDVAAAPRHDVHDDLIQRQHHVLEQSFNALRKRERALISRIAAFRGPMSFEALEIFRNPGERMRFEAALTNLQERGLLQRDLTRNRYDLHPIVRHYCYYRLNDKVGVHTRLRDYFANTPLPFNEHPRNIEDLQQVIELYHHIVCSGSYDSAWFLLSHHLAEPLQFRFGAYQVIIELVRALFPDGEDQLPRLTEGKSKAWALAELANMYSVLGKPRDAVQLLRRGEKWTHTDESQANLLDNLASQQIRLGDLAAADQSLQRSMKLRLDLNDNFWTAVADSDSALLLTYQGEFVTAESKLKIAQTVFDRYGANKTNYVSLVRARRSRLALFVGDARTALEAAREAGQLANGTACGERDIILADWLCGAALVHDKHFDAAAGHLDAALTRSRRINMVDYEAELLLEWARWHRSRGDTEQAHSHADEALTIADRCEYRLSQADIHNFLARFAMDARDNSLAREHAVIAKERAWCDGPPHCYKPALDGAEAMLKELGENQ
jgi:tetratricopeptide (TPR) repeat protein